jgi:predicted benzoate:H+ symporter BenE
VAELIRINTCFSLKSPVCFFWQRGGAVLLITTLTGNYPLVARIGGTVWVGLLSLIVSMLLVISRV